MKKALLCLWLLCPSLAQAQFTLEMGSDPAASLVASMLRDGFEQTDPSVPVNFSSQMHDADVGVALRTGALDMAIVSPLRPGLADNLQGMRFERIGRPVPKLAEIESDMTQPIPGELYAVFPQSPSMEVSRFLAFIRSREGAAILRTFGVRSVD
jgi:hypothetical protein